MEQEEVRETLFDGHIYKLHGDMDHQDRKRNFAGFDKAGASLLICTDVASRGLDFKNVAWILQWDLSSQVKEYVNRVGRTARIASAGKSCIFASANETGYVEHMEKHHKIMMLQKSRFNLAKVFEQKLVQNAMKLCKNPIKLAWTDVYYEVEIPATDADRLEDPSIGAFKPQPVVRCVTGFAPPG